MWADMCPHVSGTSHTCPWSTLFVTIVCLWLMPFLRAIPGNKEVTLLTERGVGPVDWGRQVGDQWAVW